MKNSKQLLAGSQELAATIWFEDDLGNKIRPVFQLDNDTGIKSLRVYMGGGNTKQEDLDFLDEKELVKYLAGGKSVRCRVPSGKSSNRSLYSEDVVRLVVEP